MADTCNEPKDCSLKKEDACQQSLLVPLSPLSSSSQSRNPSYESDLYVFDKLDRRNVSSLDRRRERKPRKSFIDFDDGEEQIDGESDQEGQRSTPTTLRQRSSASDAKYGQELVEAFDDVVHQDDDWANFQFYQDGQYCDLNKISNNQTPEEDRSKTPNEDDDEGEDRYDHNSELLYSRLECLEQEQDLLSDSLLALTSHFAQVQLRLRQIVEAKDVSGEKRETLLRELETFANRGIPELMLAHSSHALGGGRLERSHSLATSIMADDVFDDDDTEENKTAETEKEQNGARTTNRSHSLVSSSSTESKLDRQRIKQKELIDKLKEQLEDLERYAYETGELNSLPSSMLLERQQTIIEQLKSKLPILSIEEIDQLTLEELRTKVDGAVKQLVNPALMKEQLVVQLKTQVSDLERFIEFLQQAGVNAKSKNSHLKNSNTFARVSQLFKKSTRAHQNTSNDRGKHDRQLTNGSNECRDPANKLAKTRISTRNSSSVSNGNGRRSTHQNQQEPASNTMERIVSLLNVFTWTHFGMCSNLGNFKETRPTRFERNTLKRTTQLGRHWGDLRASLEMSIDAILAMYRDKNLHDSDYTSDIDETFVWNEKNTMLGQAWQSDSHFTLEHMPKLVRKDLAPALRNLMQHGLVGQQMDPSEQSTFSLCSSSRNAARPSTLVKSNSSNVLLNLGLGCFSSRQGVGASNLMSTGPSHAWHVLLYYYDLKNGNQFRSSPNRRLSQSYGAEVMRTSRVTSAAKAKTCLGPKHSLLAAIDDILDSQANRSLDSHFKAFVCRALNERMLACWLRLVMRNSSIICECYESWSYAASTGFEDASRQLDKLSTLRFTLPVGLALHQIESSNDAF